jgi:tetratricopeptide (TPR) repeat protein
MSLKYRIRLQNERIIGPFSTEEIGELFLKGHIEGKESCQQFPIGDWRSLQSFPALKQLIDTLEKKNLKDPTLTRPTEKIAKKATTENTSSGIKSFAEFKFGKDVKIDVDYAELEQKYKDENPDYVGEDGLERTRIIRRPQQQQASKKASADMDKTVVIKAPQIQTPVKEELAPVDQLFAKAKEQGEQIKEVIPEPTREELINEKTEFINLKSALPTINAQLSVSEAEFDKIAKIEENQEKRRQRFLQVELLRKATEDDDEDEEDEVEIETVEGTDDEQPKVVVKKKKKKGMSFIVAIAFAALFYVIMTPDEAPKATGPQYIEVKFPIQAGPDNSVEANKFLVEARGLYSQNTYIKRALASGQYLNSLQMKFSGNESMGEIILAYAELLEDTNDKLKSANTLYKYIQLSESKMVSDPAVVTGTALFFGSIKKPYTGINTIKNYLRAGGKPTPKMLAYYLQLLVEGGDLVEARKVYDALYKIPKKPFEAYNQLARYQLFNANPAEAKTILNEGLKYYPQSGLLLLSLADILLKEQAVKEYEVVLNKITAIKAESSPSYTAAYLKHMGFLQALKEDNKGAALYFKKSLQLKESDDLRMTLARLEISGDKLSQTLITESKVIGLLDKAKAEYKARNIDTAFAFAIEAVDALPNYVPAVLFLAKLNAERGLFDSAIVSLERAIAENPQNNQLKKALIQTFLSSYKFDDVEKNLSIIAQTKFANSSDYPSLMGQLAEARKNNNVALRWYNEALKLDPLNDEDMFRIAKILVRSKKFPEAKGWISKAIFLDPKNPNYLALNSEILYEQDGTDTALGYLRDIMDEEGEDPILVSTIAMTYYKSGQIKEFKNYYKRVQELPKKDERLYEFLISAAKLEGRKDEFITYSKEVIKLNPGNLKMRMDLGEFYLEEKQYNDAIDEFEEVRTRLESFPKVHYLLAKVYLSKGDVKKASEMADKELKLNPTLDTAYFIVGEVHRLNKEYREAITKYEKAISLNPRSVDALMAMGWIRLSQNYAGEAIELYNRALKEEPTLPAIHKQMGDAYRAAGQRALAKEKYEDYLKLSPGASDKELIESLIRNLQ